MLSKVLVGVLIYCKKAEDFHCPSIWIKESGSPAWAATDAAPIQKLCPEERDVFVSISHRVVRTNVISWERASGAPSV